MSNLNHDFRSSIRGSEAGNFTKPSNGGRSRHASSNGRFHYRQRPNPRPGNYGQRPNNFQRQPRKAKKSQLEGADPSIFIKKAQTVLQVENYVPHNSFADFALTNPVKQNILDHGYKQPTPVQDKAIEPILQGRDLIGLANTGTGKTAAFLIPIIDKIFRTRDKKALIVAPTRELANQINEEFRIFAKDLRVYSAVVIGGANINRQIHDIRRNPHVVIGTPGRLKDLIQQKVLRLDDFSIFVLDEVDLMVDIGFIHDVKYFVSLLPAQRQSLFFSATMPPKIQDIIATFVRNPVTVSVKVQDTAENVDQDVIKVSNPEEKIDKLHDLLIQDGFDKVLVFGRTKHGVEKLHKQLDIRGFKVGAIHGNKSQGQRQRTLDSFKRSEIQILLATDVASRGLDIDSVTHVINFDLPETYEDYVHRIGRTGRADKRGVALTFVS